MIVKVSRKEGKSNLAVMLPKGEGLCEIVDYVEATLKVIKAATQGEYYEELGNEIYLMLDFISHLLPKSSQVKDFYDHIKSETLETFPLQDPESELN